MKILCCDNVSPTIFRNKMPQRPIHSIRFVSFKNRLATNPHTYSSQVSIKMVHAWCTQGSYYDLFTAANDLLALEGLYLTGPLGLRGTLVPNSADSSGNTSAADAPICDLVSAEYDGIYDLSLKDLKDLTGPVPACIFEKTSLTTLYIGESPMAVTSAEIVDHTSKSMNTADPFGYQNENHWCRSVPWPCSHWLHAYIAWTCIYTNGIALLTLLQLVIARLPSEQRLLHRRCWTEL